MKKSIILLAIFATLFCLQASAQNVGIGTATPANKLTVNGNASIGSGYASTTAPTNGAIIEGNVGIGNSSPGTYKLNVTGNTNITGTLTITGGSPGTGKVLTSDAVGLASWTTPTTGTVTSVGLSLPGIFSVTGSPITSSGTLTGTLANQGANTVFAGPTTGTAAPTFRTLAASDIPDLSGTYIKNQTSQQASSNFNISGTGKSATMFTVGTFGTNLGVDQGGNLELGADNTTANTAGVTPYIDFHYGTGSAQDYNVRLINDAAGVLDLNGQLKITGGSPGAGKVLTSDANGLGTWASAGGLSNITVYTSGSGTYNVPAGVTKLIIKLVGGGGAGGSACYSCSGFYHVGSGGGAGGYSETVITAPASSYSYSVGAAGVTYSGTTCSTIGSPLYGGNGGNTTFGSITGNGGSGGSNSINGYGLSGGSGGTASGGSINLTGSQGGYATALSSMISGSGGASYFGGGAPAAIGFTGNLSGVSATTPGAGGSGANAYSGSTWYRGGSGGSGIIIIYEYK